MSPRQFKPNALRLLLLMLLATSLTTRAQSSFTVEEAVKYALTNSMTAKNAQLDEQSAREKVREITAIGFPQVSASYSLSNNYIIQKVIIPDGTAFGGPPGPLALEFQPQYGGQAVLSVNQLIFDGSYIVGLQAAKTYRELAQRQSDITRVQVVENVKKAYYSVLVNKERMSLLNANVARIDSTLNEMRSMLANGFVEKLDVDRLQVQRNNLVSEKDKIERFADLSLALLKFQMNYPANQDLVLTDQLAQVMVTNDMLNTAQVDYMKRPEYKLMQAQKRAASLELKNVRAGYLPSIGAQATRGALAGSNSFDRVLNPGGDWYAFGALGLSIQVPIFDSFSKRFQAQQKKINVMKVDNGIQEYRRAIDLQVEQAQIAVRNTFQTVDIQKQNLTLSEDVLRVSRLKYSEGVGSNLEVVTAEAAYREAQSNYYTAVYDLLVARIDLEKAKGELIR